MKTQILAQFGLLAVTITYANSTIHTQLNIIIKWQNNGGHVICNGQIQSSIVHSIRLPFEG